jgi:hypothetical protein
MLIHRTNPLTGEERSREIPVTEAQLREWQDGTPIEEAMSHLTTEEREFITAGVNSSEVAVWAINLMSEQESED